MTALDLAERLRTLVERAETAALEDRGGQPHAFIVGYVREALKQLADELEVTK